MENYERLQEIGKGNFLVDLIFNRKLRVGLQDQTKGRQLDSCVERARLW